MLPADNGVVGEDTGEELEGAEADGPEVSQETGWLGWWFRISIPGRRMGWDVVWDGEESEGEEVIVVGAVEEGSSWRRREGKARLET
jgi:hypothetical protein